MHPPRRSERQSEPYLKVPFKITDDSVICPHRNILAIVDGDDPKTRRMRIANFGPFDPGDMDVMHTIGVCHVAFYRSQIEMSMAGEKNAYIRPLQHRRHQVVAHLPPPGIWVYPRRRGVSEEDNRKVVIFINLLEQPDYLVLCEGHTIVFGTGKNKKASGLLE